MKQTSIQVQLADSIKSFYKGSIIKKVDKDNFLDIHIPSINNSKSTHLFFNTAKGQIKVGFYVRDVEFINKILVKSSGKIESYSQGIRLKDNPSFNSFDEGIKAAKDLLSYIDLTIKKPKLVSQKSPVKKKVISNPKKLKSDPFKDLDDIESSILREKPKGKSQNKINDNWFSRFLYYFSRFLSKNE